MIDYLSSDGRPLHFAHTVFLHHAEDDVIFFFGPCSFMKTRLSKTVQYELSISNGCRIMDIKKSCFLTLSTLFQRCRHCTSVLVDPNKLATFFQLFGPCFSTISRSKLSSSIVHRPPIDALRSARGFASFIIADSSPDTMSSLSSSSIKASEAMFVF